MSRKMLLAVFGFAVFSALPLLTASDEVKAQSTTRVSRNPDSPWCYTPGGSTSRYQVMNTGTMPAGVTASYYKDDGSFVVTQTAEIAGPGSGYFMPPAGFEGSAVISSDRPVAAIANLQGGSTADSPFASFKCPTGFPFSGVVFPVWYDKQLIYVQNTAGSPTMVTGYVYDQGGRQSENPYEGTLEPYAMGEFTPRQAGGRNFDWPGSALPFGSFSHAIFAYTMWPSGSADEPPDVLPGVDFGNSSAMNYLALPDVDVVGPYTATYTVLNHKSSEQSLRVETWPPDGPPSVVTETLPSQGTFQGSVVVMPGGDPIASVVFVAPNSSAVTTYTGFSGGGRFATSRSGSWPASKPSDVITKRGYGYGAPSTKQSKVSVVLRNVGAKKLKVKFRVFNGDTGKKVQSGTANIGVGSTATVAFKKRARGNNLYVEISVKGKGSVLGWLMRTYKGDVDFYTAVPR